MSLAPSASVILGNEQFDTHVLRLTAQLAPLPAAGSFHALFPASTQISASAGDDATLALDGGEGSETVLTGSVRMIRRGISQIEVVVADGGALLGDLRPATTYRNQGADDIIKALASDANVDVSSSDTGIDIAAYVADQNRTAARHIAELAAFAGAMARINGDGELVVDRPSAVMPDVAIKYGREVITCDVQSGVAPSAKRFRMGNGPAGSTTAPDALRPSKKPLPSGADDAGVDALWTPAAVLRTPTAAATASAATDAATSAASSRIRATAFLLPKLRPGVVLDVQDVPGGGGPWLLTRVVHVLDARDGGRTYFEGEEAPSLDLAALAGAALAALGSLL